MIIASIFASQSTVLLSCQCCVCHRRLKVSRLSLLHLSQLGSGGGSVYGVSHVMKMLSVSLTGRYYYFSFCVLQWSQQESFDELQDQ